MLAFVTGAITSRFLMVVMLRILLRDIAPFLRVARRMGRFAAERRFGLLDRREIFLEPDRRYAMDAAANGSVVDVAKRFQVGHFECPKCEGEGYL